MRVNEIGGGGSPPGGTRIRGEERGNESALGRRATEVADDAGAVGDAEVTERRRRDDVDLDSEHAEVLDRVPQESTGCVALVARKRGGQDCYPHDVRLAESGRNAVGK